VSQNVGNQAPPYDAKHPGAAEASVSYSTFPVTMQHSLNQLHMLNMAQQTKHCVSCIQITVAIKT